MSKIIYRIRDISIRNKLVSIQFFTCLIVLALCCAAFVVDDVNSYKESRLKSLSSMAKVIGSSSISSLVFLDNAAANDILSDLRVEADVMNAVIFDKNGSAFATYAKAGSNAYRFSFTVAEKVNFEFKGRRLFVYHKIIQKGDIVGIVCLYAELSELNNVVREKIQIAVVVLIIGMVLAFLIATTIQKYISNPILNLVKLVQKISGSGSYKDRAPVEGKDEIGTLSLVFNNMLMQIEKRGEALSDNINLLNSILQSIGDGVVVTDKNGKFILCNPAGKEIIRLGSMNNPEKWTNTYGIFLPHTTTLFTPPELPLARSIEGEELNNFEMVIRNPEIQEVLFFSVTSRPLKDQYGSLIGGVGVFRDITERKKMEDALQAAKQQLQGVMDNSLAIIYIKNLDGQYLFINRQFEKLFHVSREKIIGMTDYQLWPQEFADRFVVNDKQVLEEGKPFTYEETVPHENVIHTYVSVKFPMQDQSGKRYAVCGISTDITERKRAEEADKKRVAQMIRFQEIILALTHPEEEMSLESKLNYIIELTSKGVRVERVSIWLYDEMHSLIYSNKFYILSNQGFIPGMTIHIKDYPEYFKAIEKNPLLDARDALNDPRTSELSDNYLKPFGISSMLDIPIRIGPQMIGIICLEHTDSKRIWSYEEQVFLSSIAGIIAVAIEHDRRLKAEISIRQSEEKYRFLAETVPQLVWTAKPDGGIDYNNRNLYEYTGKPFEYMKEWGWKSVIHPDDLQNTLQLWAACLQTGNPFQIEFRILGKDGKYRWYLNRATAQKNEDGKVIKWFGSATDINEQKEIFEKLKLNNEELIRINNDLDNFIYTASHDLKAPIANLEGLLNGIMQDMKEQGKKDVIAMFDMMKVSIQRLKSTIAELTEISKIQRNHGESRELLEINTIIEEFKAEFSVQLKESNTVIMTHLAVKHILFSQKNFRSIIYNLLDNAIKYRSPERRSEIIVRTEIINNDYILLSVKDNGLGFDISKKDKVFGMFRRLHPDIEGTGIGLYIVKKIVENAGGKVDVESEVNKGSVFKIYFKVKNQ